jgi:hypothetical protein
MADVVACEWAVHQLFGVSYLLCLPGQLPNHTSNLLLLLMLLSTCISATALQEMLFAVSKGPAQNQRNAAALKQMIAAADAMVSLASSDSGSILVRHAVP